jgi:hypothetical protein
MSKILKGFIVYSEKNMSIFELGSYVMTMSLTSIGEINEHNGIVESLIKSQHSDL